ncbi:MAG: MarR family transcriptional regulator [Microbacterium sp.]|nr:MarR family transcriptional regulator [Microbacterium sp.]
MTDRRLAVEAWESLFRAQHEVFGEISEDFEGSALSQGEYDVLLTVTRGPDQTARLRDVTANMLISKCADPDDGRGALGRATDEGVAKFRAIAAAHAARISERMAVLDDDELRQLRTLTAKLRTPRPTDC